MGIPSDLEIALFAFGPLGALRRRGAFRDALTREITEIAQWGGDDVVFQLECPVELIMLATVPRWLRPALARLLLRPLMRLVTAAPPGSRFGVHLCMGDLNHRAMRHLRDTGPIVVAARELLRAWPLDRRLEFIHFPLAAGERPAPVAARFYVQLRHLRTAPTSTRLIAGLVHEGQELTDQRTVLRVVETALKRPVDVAPACGLGRRSPEEAAAVLSRAVPLGLRLAPWAGGRVTDAEMD
ncbi:hypothetical protein [Salinactinospora qingdaonensis]|uniref:Uncharacterized protein n=1 Tax=Salinactinospora qingdaonensis TaxID=702744 RepID=A0ABP7FE43_9ACTN